jgi:hypothetical protein
MAFGLGKEQKQFTEAARYVDDGESDYLTLPLLSPSQVDRIYGGNKEDEIHELRFGRAAFAAVRRAARKGA